MERFPGGPWLALTVVWIMLVAAMISTRGSVSIAVPALVPSSLAIVIAAWLFLQRGAEADLRALGSEKRLISLTAAKGTARIEAVCGVIFGIAYAIAMVMTFHQEVGFFPDGFGSLPEDHSNTFTALVALIFVYFGVCQVHMWCSFVRQVNVIAWLTKKIEVDLLRIEYLEIFGNLARRAGLLGTAYMAWIAFLGQIIDLPSNFTYGWYPLVLLLGIVYTTRPLLAVRRRIRVAKNRELHLIHEAIDGRWDGFADSRLAHLQNELGVADLLAYEERIQSVWEWPIEKRVRRLVLYLVMPPIAWVLGALVERLIETYLS